ncbi:MAG: heparinase II/III family protein, partial [Planctomycetota bacterium]
MNRPVFLILVCLAAGSAGAAEEQAADRRTDADYLDHQIKHVADADLFTAIDLDRPGLAAVKAAAESGDYPAAYRAWADYWKAKEKLAWIEHDGHLQAIDEVSAALVSDPARVEQAEKAAEPVMRHEICGWGSVTHQHGETVDFNFDYGRSGKYGFHYWGWSAPLLTAFHATGTPKYLAEFDRLFNAWYLQRDAVQGAIRNLDVVWYELGLGLRNRKFLDYYTRDYAERPMETHERMLKTALGAARWLYELQRRGYRDGNWQIMGSYGLVDIAVRLPEFRESPEWLEVGVGRLVEHVNRDFYEDGCHSERAPTSYMSIAYRDPRNLMALLRAAGVENESVRQFGTRLEKVLEWWALATNPLGALPALND